MLPEHRRSRILDVLHVRQRASVNELAGELDVSRETVRRDLGRLDKAGLLRKVHGGAIPLQAATEPSLCRRAMQQRIEKQRIAERAATLFEAGDSLFVDAGSTTTVFAAALAAGRHLMVITNSLEVAGRLSAAGNKVRVHLLGGDFRASGLETIGTATIEQASRFRPDHAVLTVGTIDVSGDAFDFDPEEAAVARIMIRQARMVTLLADHTKFGRPALEKICHLRQVHRLVTDERPTKAMAAAIRAAGVELVVAGAPTGKEIPASAKGDTRRTHELLRDRR